ncbi:MAG: 16S rRNA (guanine(527)-N(7))-methyltransferase RsmG [Thermoleophilaceae bacterium]
MTVAELTRRYGLPGGAGRQLTLLLDALEAEPDPHTAIRGRDEAVRMHLADSLSGLEIEGLRGARRIADVGAGAGFPGLALAVALPGAEVDLVESAGRKCGVIERLASAAGLGNAHAVHARAEEHAAAGGAGAYDAVTARAVAPLAVLLEYAAPLLREGGSLVAWRGRRDREQERSAERSAALLGLSPGQVRLVSPFPGARDRHLHVHSKVKPTPDRFPRRPGMAAKRPLG